MILGKALHATLSRCGPALKDWERELGVRQLKVRCYRYEVKRKGALIPDPAKARKIQEEIAYTRQRQGLPALKRYREEEQESWRKWIWNPAKSLR